MLTDQDVYYFREGTHGGLYRALGCHLAPRGGARFALWAPNAQSVSVIGEFNGWNREAAPMARLGHCPSGRLFEAAACGAPIISDWWPGLYDFFEPGRDIIVAGAGRYLLPGLADMHVHLEGETSPDRYLERFTLNPEDLAFRSTVFARRTLEAGFTTVRDLGGTGVNTALRNAIEAGLVAGPRIISVNKGLAVTGGHGDPTNGYRRDLMGEPGAHMGVVDGVPAMRQGVQVARDKQRDARHRRAGRQEPVVLSAPALLPEVLGLGDRELAVGPEQVGVPFAPLAGAPGDRRRRHIHDVARRRLPHAAHEPGFRDIRYEAGVRPL